MPARSDDGAFYVGVIHLDGDARVRISGEIDLAARNEVIRTVEPLIKPRRPLILDMTGVTFLDSSGIAAIVHLRRATDAAGTTLTIQSNDKVRACLRLTGLDQLLLDGEREVR